ncbi:hypothetical protein GO491_07380 [Flavobacteriaceae bacterium Ap0902]|nr:hypothetical protein [Flavobacteriaceae bacterium Ap0902]
MRKLSTFFIGLSASILTAQIPVATDTVIDRTSEAQKINIGDFVEMSGQWFISYRDIHEDYIATDGSTMKDHQSSVFLKRSYFTLEKDLNATFSVRYTQDITIDTEGDDAGNVETRLKYLYVRAKPKVNIDWLTGLWIEGGMVHRPWLDYEQKVNTYRAQDNMAIERNKIFNSADFGLTVGGNIGPKMDREFLKTTNGAMKGKYLTYVLGIYNGGGYSGAEKNNNKVIAGRFSVRPLPAIIPELQFSGYFNVGKGNTEYNPDFNQWLGMAAYTGRNLTLTAQYHDGTGDYKGRYVEADDPSKALDNHGYSIFGEYKIGNTPWAIWGRHDSFTLENGIDDDITRNIGGISYRYNRNIRLIANTEHTKQLDDKTEIYELTLEIVF